MLLCCVTPFTDLCRDLTYHLATSLSVTASSPFSIEPFFGVSHVTIVKTWAGPGRRQQCLFRCLRPVRERISLRRLPPAISQFLVSAVCTGTATLLLPAAVSWRPTPLWWSSHVRSASGIGDTRSQRSSDVPKPARVSFNSRLLSTSQCPVSGFGVEIGVYGNTSLHETRRSLYFFDVETA